MIVPRLSGSALVQAARRTIDVLFDIDDNVSPEISAHTTGDAPARASLFQPPSGRYRRSRHT